MSNTLTPLSYVISHPGQFSIDVLRGFRENQGLLLAGAVAYYTLLSIVPVFALMLIVLSYFVDTQLLLETLSTFLMMATPARIDTLTTHLETFLANWRVIGTVGILLLIFFSSLAFTVLENAMSAIFFHRQLKHRRHFLVSAVLPYIYILLLTAGFLVVSLMSGWLHQHSAATPSLFGIDINMTQTTATVLYALGVFGEILLLTSVYLVASRPTGLVTCPGWRHYSYYIMGTHTTYPNLVLFDAFFCQCYLWLICDHHNHSSQL